jgi:hypothetical protein
MDRRGLRRTPRKHSIAPAALATLAVLLSAGCGNKMSEADCTAVAANMRKVWDAAAKKASAPDAPGAEKAALVIQAEGERLVSEWISECRTELAGRRVEKREIDCLLAAGTIEDIGKCAESR